MDGKYQKRIGKREWSIEECERERYLEQRNATMDPCQKHIRNHIAG
jgi:hypothetical protein